MCVLNGWEASYVLPNRKDGSICYKSTVHSLTFDLTYVGVCQFKKVKSTCSLIRCQRILQTSKLRSCISRTIWKDPRPDQSSCHLLCTYQVVNKCMAHRNKGSACLNFWENIASLVMVVGALFCFTLITDQGTGKWWGSWTETKLTVLERHGCMVTDVHACVLIDTNKQGRHCRRDPICLR